MTLDYVALVLLIIILALVVYGLIAVWSIPYEIAQGRNHPHREAIGVATWVSLFTLGVLWPFLWIWATAWRPEHGWGFSDPGRDTSAVTPAPDLESRVTRLEAALKQG